MLQLYFRFFSYPVILQPFLPLLLLHVLQVIQSSYWALLFNHWPHQLDLERRKPSLSAYTYSLTPGPTSPDLFVHFFSLMRCGNCWLMQLINMQRRCALVHHMPSLNRCFSGSDEGLFGYPHLGIMKFSPLEKY